MKQIVVNSNCNGCGLCVVNCKYIEENDEGNAQAISGMAMYEDDEKEIEDLIQKCPVHAIRLVDTGVARKSGKEGVMEIVECY